MLTKIKKLFTRPNAPSRQASIHERSEHKINDKQISEAALRVIEELQRAGFEAYLVGGGVRDLLLGTKPKDFDVATDAHPEQVQGVFRRAHIIGRRFKIVHVRMGRDVIEVTTFRGSHEVPNKAAQQSSSGVLLRDNVYGNLESDAFRRDFSVNALYYNPRTDQVIDYTQGFQDLRNGVLRIIGNPESRYKEDPVRMLRAVRFACKLNFTLSKESEAPIRAHAEYLREIASARLFEEVLKLFMSGHAEAVLLSLQDYKLLNYLFPGTARALKSENPVYRALSIQAARNTDLRIRQDKRVTPAFIYAAFLWLPLQEALQQLAARQPRLSPQERLQGAGDAVVSEQLQATAVPKRFLIPMREIWSLQSKLERRDGRRAFTLLEHPRFRAAYDFLLLREAAGEETGELGTWWTRFQDASAEEQEALVNELPRSANPRARRRRPRKKSSND